MKTVRFVKLLDAEVNLGDWVKAIIEQCNFGPLVDINIGISFTSAKKFDTSVKYMYCPKSAASFSNMFQSRKEALMWADSLRGINSKNELMELSFLNNSFGEEFKSSGWTCRTPVALHMWIQK